MKELTKEELESMEKKAKCPILKCHIFRERNDVVILSEEIYKRFQGKRVRITIEEVE